MPILFQRLHHRSSVTIKFFFFFLASEYSTVIYTLYNWIFNSNFFLKVFSFRIELFEIFTIRINTSRSSNFELYLNFIQIVLIKIARYFDLKYSFKYLGRI